MISNLPRFLARVARGMSDEAVPDGKMEEVDKEDADDVARRRRLSMLWMVVDQSPQTIG